MTVGTLSGFSRLLSYPIDCFSFPGRPNQTRLDAFDTVFIVVSASLKKTPCLTAFPSTFLSHTFGQKERERETKKELIINSSSLDHINLNVCCGNHNMRLNNTTRTEYPLCSFHGPSYNGCKQKRYDLMGCHKHFGSVRVHKERKGQQTAASTQPIRYKRFTEIKQW